MEEKRKEGNENVECREKEDGTKEKEREEKKKVNRIM